MKCTNPNCGHEIPDDSKFCPDCGTKIISLELVAQKDFRVNGVEFTMILVNKGSFTKRNLFGQEKLVSISCDYYIGSIPVTEELWEAVMGYNPREEDDEAEYFQERSKYPVSNISWYDCQVFIRTLNRLTGEMFYMPNENEWEFAALGGNLSEDYIWAGSSYEPNVKPDDYCYYYEGMELIHATKELIPNKLGLYDMTGNAYEFCDGEEMEKPVRGGFVVAYEGGYEIIHPQKLQESYNNRLNPNVKTRNHSFRLALRINN